MSYREALNKEPNIINGTNFNKIKSGLNDFIFGKRVIHTYFRLSENNSNELYIFLSAIGFNPGKPYPLFQRISWESIFSGNILCIDDPTRFEIDFAPCFYFGSANNNCLDQIQNIIKNISRIYNIENSKIYFISSSNGGFASLYLANKFPRSICIALNPQLDVDLYLEKQAKIFYNKLNINSNEYKERLNLYYLIDTKAFIVIFSNIKCKKDKIQIDNFCKANSINYNIGLNRIKDNIFLIVTNINAIDPHLVQPNALFCNFIKNYIFNSNINILNEYIYIYIYIDSLRINSLLEWKNKIVINFSNYFNNIISADVKNQYVEIFLKDAYNSKFYIYYLKNNCISFKLNVKIINKPCSLVDINNFALTHNLSVQYDSDNISLSSLDAGYDFNNIYYLYNRIANFLNNI